MASPISGLHHVTATVDDAQADLDFFGSALGLRLVKQTVNFDNRHVFHFYYGNERGTPGTIWTTFPYKGMGVRVGRRGAGQIGVTSFSVPSAALEFWEGRLRDGGVAVQHDTQFGDRSLLFHDPSGLMVELVGTDRDARAPWRVDGIDRGAAVRGLHGVTMSVHAAGPTVDFMTGVLGFRTIDRTADRVRVGVNGDEPGRTIDIVHSASLPHAVNGLGTVHHVAMAVPTAEDQTDIREELLKLGIQVTPIMDRQYFTSIYFREPGGVLFEIATVPPGFTRDETLEGLGRELKLPPWEEANRAAIEAGLPKITIPRA